MESAELRNQRLKEVFQAKVQEFRKVCYTLTGYQVDITRESQYRLTSMYAERQDDCLVFKVGLRTARAPLVRGLHAVLGARLWLGGLRAGDGRAECAPARRRQHTARVLAVISGGQLGTLSETGQDRPELVLW